jgi:hypothetical protein
LSASLRGIDAAYPGGLWMIVDTLSLGKSIGIAVGPVFMVPAFALLVRLTASS